MNTTAYYRSIVVVGFGLLLLPGARADEATLSSQFTEVVLPLVNAHCMPCHDAENREAELDLERFASWREVSREHALWEIVMERVAAEEMPPADHQPSLAAEGREALLRWIRDARRFEAERNAGDPGVVLARRLSNVEFDYSIRDLTGVDIRPTSTFPVDPANEAGFDNSGESLTMSPALLSKYLEAARTVASHLVLTPDGIDFAPHPVQTDTDRDKYSVKRIVEFYQRQPTDFASYLFAATVVRTQVEREASEGEPRRSLVEVLQGVARDQKVSSRYLQRVWDALHDDSVIYGPLAHVRERWDQIDLSLDEPALRDACREMADYITAARKLFEPYYENLKTRGIHDGSQAFVLWKNRQYAANRRTAFYRFLEPENVEPEKGAEKQAKKKGADKTKEPPQHRSLPSILPPESLANLADYRRDCERFCELFPDAFYISERGRDYLGIPKEKQEKGRLLSAGFHSMMGYFRDDRPLCELILSEEEVAELDRLWDELEFFANVPDRQYQGMLWFERTDSGYLRDEQFDFARPENLAALEEPAIEKLAQLYLEKAISSGAGETAQQAIRDYFVEMNRRIRNVETKRASAQKVHLEQLMELAGKAFRRPISDVEQTQMRADYTMLRQTEELRHEEAIEDVFVSILVSPYFTYRWDLISQATQPETLTDIELASRLSYFLWSTLPDDELLHHAATGTLHEPEVLKSQVRRMVADPRIRGLATEFTGNWLDFRRFEEHNSVDRNRFPQFDSALRTAMFEEPIRFMVEVLQENHPIDTFLDADWTYVNGPLGAHYGIPGVEPTSPQWQRVEGMRAIGRGGLVPMAVFLTRNAPGLRTSPVKRGYWVVRRLLGEHIPAPPPNVPDLPEDESKLGELSLREVLAKHREHPSCAPCHEKFDALGIALEGFGPIGERRSEDLAGKAIDTLAVFPDGRERDGLAPLREYLIERRREEFVDNFCEKLISYSLNRGTILSDQSLKRSMIAAGMTDDYRIGTLLETIVTSPQFLTKRGLRDDD